MHTRLLLALAVALAAGCYEAHGAGRDGGPGRDAGGPRDGAVAADGGVPCTTVCDPPRVLARVPIDVSESRTPAVLDANVHRDELVVALLVARMSFSDPAPAFSLVRISRRTGEVRTEVVDVRTVTHSIGAGALASRGEALTLITAHASSSFTDEQPAVLVATWEGAAAAPTTSVNPLTDGVLPRCAYCVRRGASVAVGERGGIVALTGEGVLYLGRVDLESGAVSRETIPLPSVVPNTALDARGDRRDAALLAVGGLRDVGGATPSPALAMVASASTLEAPISVPGEPSDAVPHPWLHGGALEVVRFLRDEGVAGGRLHRYALEGSGTTEIGTLATAGGLSPLAMASTPSALLWIEASLSAVGEADLRVLAEPPPTCDGATPASVVHLRTPLASQDPRVLAATEADGRTYAVVLEQAPPTYDEAVLVVLDLGACRDGG